jgi:hypothetical protein
MYRSTEAFPDGGTVLTCSLPDCRAAVRLTAARGPVRTATVSSVYSVPPHLVVDTVNFTASPLVGSFMRTVGKILVFMRQWLWDRKRSEIYNPNVRRCPRLSASGGHSPKISAPQHASACHELAMALQTLFRIKMMALRSFEPACDLRDGVESVDGQSGRDTTVT